MTKPNTKSKKWSQYQEVEFRELSIECNIILLGEYPGDIAPLISQATGIMIVAFPPVLSVDQRRSVLVLPRDQLHTVPHCYTLTTTDQARVQ